MNTGKFLTISADEYHSASRNGQYMSSHREASRRSEAKTDFWPTSACIRRSLGEGGRESPELYRRKTNGEIASADTQSLALGRAAHCLILEGREAFNE